jgi:hypothetical protein
MKGVFISMLIGADIAVHCYMKPKTIAAVGDYISVAHCGGAL